MPRLWFRLPLHLQILLGLVAGAAFGSLVNLLAPELAAAFSSGLRRWARCSSG